MKTMTKNFMIAASLALITTSAFSQVGNRDEERRARSRERHREMNICAEIKQDLLSAEDAYVSAANRISAADQRISQEKNVLNSRRDTLERKKTAYETAKMQVQELTQLKADKPRLMAENNRKLNEANVAIPGAQTEVQAAKQRKDSECKGLGLSRRCRDAKRNLDDKESTLKNLNNKKNSAMSAIERLNRVESDLTRVESIKISAESSLRDEESISPSIADLSTAVRQLVDRRNQEQIAFTEIEDAYGRLEIRLEICQQMTYDARNGKAFKKALLVFARDNAAGCGQAVRLIREANTPAAKDGINEAYELVCKSDILVRRVEVPAVNPIQ